MSAFGELVSSLLGPLGELVAWLFSLLPRYEIVHWDETAVCRTGGRRPKELGPGYHWYWPVRSEITKHHTSTCTLPVPGVALETSCGQKIVVSAVVTYDLVDPVTYDARNYDADGNMQEAAQGGLRRVANELRWEDLREIDDETLRHYMQEELSRFGVEIRSARFGNIIRLGRGAYQIFGLQSIAPAAEEVDE